MNNKEILEKSLRQVAFKQWFDTADENQKEVVHKIFLDSGCPTFLAFADYVGERNCDYLFWGTTVKLSFSKEDKEAIGIL